MAHTFTERELRDAFGRFATGVTVITTHWNQADWGVTVNSFSSVSLEPSLALFCLDHRAQSHAAFTETAYFAVNILSVEQEAHSRHFAQAGTKTWDGIAATRDDATGCLTLDGALGHLLCRRDACHPGGDHTIILGEVLSLSESAPRHAPLLYYRGEYATPENPEDTAFATQT